MKTATQTMILVTTIALALTGVAQAEDYDFNGFTVDVEAWTGTGSNETILVVDWNKLDNAEATVSESHAFGYRWDGVKYESDMLTDFHNAGVFTVDWGANYFLLNITYNDLADSEVHLHTEPGSWNCGSTTNPDARWGSWGDTEWDFNQGGIDAELLADGQYEGANAVLYFTTTPDYANDQLDIPVPEPTSMAVLGLAGLALLRRRRRA